MPATPPPRPRGRSRAGQTLRMRLSLVVAAVAIPMLGVVVVLIWSAQRDDRRRAEERLLEQASTLALVVDREFARGETVLTMLAAQPPFAHMPVAAADLAQLETAMRHASGVLHGAAVGLLDADCVEVLNTLWAPGERRHGTPGPTELRAVLAGGRPAVVDLYRGATSGDLHTAVAVPLAGPDGRPAYLLAAAMPGAVLGNALGELKLPPGWVGGVLDRHYRLVARTERADGAVGTEAGDAVRAALQTADRAVIRGPRTVDGVPASIALARAPASGFIVGLSVADEAFAGPLRVALWRAVVAGALASGLGLAVALAIARGIAASIRSLADSGTAGPTRLREVQEVADRLARATAERDHAEAALHALVGQLRAEVAARSAELADEAQEPFRMIGLLRPDGTVLQVNRAALAWSGLQAEAVVRRPLWHAGWWGGDLDHAARLSSAVARAAAGAPVWLDLAVERADPAERPLPVTLGLVPVHGCIAGPGAARATAEVRLLLVEAQQGHMTAEPSGAAHTAAAAVRRLVEIVDAASAPANGAHPPPPPALPPALPARPRAPPRVLLVEDSTIMRALLAGDLHQRGYDVAQAQDAPEALAMVQREPFDLLISDLVMLGPSGLELARDARALRPDLPVLLLTGHAGDAPLLVATAPGSGAFMLMRKPHAGGQWLQHVAALLHCATRPQAAG